MYHQIALKLNQLLWVNSVISDLDKAPRLSIRIVIWILSSDISHGQLNQNVNK